MNILLEMAGVTWVRSTASHWGRDEPSMHSRCSYPSCIFLRIPNQEEHLRFFSIKLPWVHFSGLFYQDMKTYKTYICNFNGDTKQRVWIYIFEDQDEKSFSLIASNIEIKKNITMYSCIHSFIHSSIHQTQIWLPNIKLMLPSLVDSGFKDIVSYF